MSPVTIYWPERSGLKCGVPLTEEGWKVKCDCGHESGPYGERIEAMGMRTEHMREKHGQAGFKTYNRKGGY